VKLDRQPLPGIAEWLSKQGIALLDEPLPDPAPSVYDALFKSAMTFAMRTGWISDEAYITSFSRANDNSLPRGIRRR
jgi:hypothetical protein